MIFFSPSSISLVLLIFIVLFIQAIIVIFLYEVYFICFSYFQSFCDFFVTYLLLICTLFVICDVPVCVLVSYEWPLARLAAGEYCDCSKYQSIQCNTKEYNVMKEWESIKRKTNSYKLIQIIKTCTLSLSYTLAQLLVSQISAISTEWVTTFPVYVKWVSESVFLLVSWECTGPRNRPVDQIQNQNLKSNTMKYKTMWRK